MPALEDTLASLAESLEILSSRMRTGMDVGEHEHSAGKAPSLGGAFMSAMFGPTSVMTPNTPLGQFARRNYQLSHRTGAAMKPFKDRIRKSKLGRSSFGKSWAGRRMFGWDEKSHPSRPPDPVLYPATPDSVPGAPLVAPRPGTPPTPGTSSAAGPLHVWIDGPFPFPGTPGAGMPPSAPPPAGGGPGPFDLVGDATAPLPPGGTPVTPSLAPESGHADPHARDIEHEAEHGIAGAAVRASAAGEGAAGMAGAAGAGEGAAGMAGMAGAVGAVAGGAAVFATAVFEFGKNVYEFAKAQEQTIREQAKVGGMQAGGIAQLDSERTMRDIRTANETGASSVGLTQSLSAFEEKLQPFQVAVENISNLLGEVLLDVISGILDLLKPMADGINELVNYFTGTPTPPAANWDAISRAAAAADRLRPTWP